jgi:beta-glucosidase
VKAASDSAEDIAAVSRHDALRNRWFLDVLYGRGYPAERWRWWARMRQGGSGRHGGHRRTVRFPRRELLLPEVVEDAPDQYPLRTRIVHPQDRQRTDFGWEVSPEGWSRCWSAWRATIRPATCTSPKTARPTTTTWTPTAR